MDSNKDRGSAEMVFRVLGKNAASSAHTQISLQVVATHQLGIVL